MKILIVDDDAFILGMYVTKFQKAGFEVDTARSGTDVLKKLQEGAKPDILLSDVVLPGMDGIELLREIRKENLGGTMMIIMLTNQGGSEEMEEAKKLGVNGYIVKASLIPSEIVTKVLEISQNKKS